MPDLPRRRCVLCVDDERVVLDSLRSQLHELGDELGVEIAESGAEALELFDELVEGGTDVPLVIADQLMPGIKGEELLARVHSRDQRTLTIMLTGQATAEDVGAAVNSARLYRFLAKPWSREDLLLTVREALRAWDGAREVERQEAEILQAHTASLRFVPAEFLALLGRARVNEVRVGDHADREINVFFSDMRGYTTLVEGRRTREAFDFVNEYMQRMRAPIAAHGGFVCALDGDAILALFPGAADDAVLAAVESHRVLGDWNRDRIARGERPVGMGVAVHTGHALLAAIGGEERLYTGRVGEAIELASRIESLTKLFRTAVIISSETRARLDRPEALHLREVARVRIDGRPVTLFEVLDALPEERARARTRSLPEFADARGALAEGRVESAIHALDHVLADDPEDAAAAVLRERCRDLLERGLPEGGSGDVDLEVR